MQPAAIAQTVESGGRWPVSVPRSLNEVFRHGPERFAKRVPTREQSTHSRGMACMRCVREKWSD